MNKQSPVLITGGSGLIGSAITKVLIADRMPVRWYSRNDSRKPDGVEVYRWDPAKSYCDPSALRDVETIVHLAGAGIADQRWTDQRKREIIGSRTASAFALYDTLKKHPNSVKTIVAASATGYYGDRQDAWVGEDSTPGSGFLADTCVEWERALSRFSDLGIRVVILRVGFVLSMNGGALPVMRKPVDWLVGAPLGSGRQYISWIDLDDLVGMFRFAMDNSAVKGTYNAVAPAPVTNRQMTNTLGKVLHRPIWPFPVPAPLLNLLLGEKAALVTTGQRVSSEKILQAGFQFRYAELEASLRHQLS